MDPIGLKDSYERFIQLNRRKWGPFAELLTNFHLKAMKLFDFLDDKDENHLTGYKFFFKYFHMVLKNSSVHGTYQAAQIRRHPCEVILWCSLILLAGFSSILIISLFWTRYFDHPTVMSIEMDYMNWNVSYPALTVCSSEKLNKSALNEYVRASNATNKRQLVTFIRQLVNLTYDTIGEIHDVPGITGDEYLKILEKVTYNVEADMVTATNDSYSLQRVLTEMGMCYSFNWKIARYFSVDYFLKDQLPQESEEYSVSVFDLEKVVFLRDIPRCCEIYTHDSLDIPNSRKRLKVTNQATTFTLLKFRAIPIVSSTSVRKLYIEQRKCRYMDESNLKHFAIYTYSLCKTECKIDAILRFCECIPFFYKRLPGEKYCSSKGLKCISYHYEQIRQVSTKCYCYSNCEDTKFIMEEFSSVFWMLPSAIRMELANTKMRLRRNVIYNWIDVMVGTGNVFSLFLGISVLSFVEFVYFYFINLPLKWTENKRKQEQLSRIRGTTQTAN